MKCCSIPLCANDSDKRPDLKYFALPRNANLREEWLEVIGGKGNYRGQNLYKTFICENHFSDLDFKAGKKELKAHAVPVVDFRIGDVQFIPDSSDFKPEVMEIARTEVAQEQKTPAKKKLPLEEKPVPEPTPPTECEPGKRPSRRAAVEAAKKIFNTVRNYNVKDLQSPDDAPSQAPPPNKTPTTQPQVRKRRRNNDLDMFCDEEALSESQTASQQKAQNDFNLAMKNMRELEACKIKIVQTGTPVDFNVVVNVFADDDEDVIRPVKLKSNDSRVLSKFHVPHVYPVRLTQVANRQQVPLIYF